MIDANSLFKLTMHLQSHINLNSQKESIDINQSTFLCEATQNNRLLTKKDKGKQPPHEFDELEAPATTNIGQTYENRHTMV